MKNLKKLSRNDLKRLHGGEIIDGPPRKGFGGSGNGDTWHCCNKTTNVCGPCGGAGACDEGSELRFC